MLEYVGETSAQYVEVGDYVNGNRIDKVDLDTYEHIVILRYNGNQYMVPKTKLLSVYREANLVCIENHDMRG